MSKFDVVAPDAKIDYLYGGEDFELTISDIAELLKGNKLVGTVNYEYVITIKLQEENKE